MGRDLWQALARDFPRLYWRTRAGNPTAAWYLTVCDGMLRLPGWQVFWRGLAPSEVPAIAEHATSLEDDFPALTSLAISLLNDPAANTE